MIVERQAVVGVPEEFEADNSCTLDMPPGFVDYLTDVVGDGILAEVGHPEARVKLAYWVIACDKTTHLIDAMPNLANCPPPGPCQSCQTGRDVAKAWVRDHPGRHVAIGLITFEV